MYKQHATVLSLLSLICFERCIYLFESQSQREGRRHRDLPSTSSLGRWTLMTRASAGQSQKSGASFESIMWFLGDQTFGPSSIVFLVYHQGDVLKCNSQDMNQHPNGMLELQALVLHATPQCQPPPHCSSESWVDLWALEMNIPTVALVLGLCSREIPARVYTGRHIQECSH